MRTILVLLCVAIPVSGCYSRRVMPVEEVKKLDGFEAGTEVQLLYNTPFSESTYLAFVVEGVEYKAYRYVHIEIDGDQFVGRSADPPAVLRIDLAQFDQMVVYVPQHGRVARGVIGGVVAVPVYIFLSLALMGFVVWGIITLAKARAE